MACCLFALLFALMPASQLSAQTSGTVSGHVTDSTGAVIPGADVTLRNMGTGASRMTLTTDSGDYTFAEVPPARYRILVSRQGFKT